MNTKKLKQLVLDLAIHGKLVPQDPNDEPASELLARIKAEKAQMSKTAAKSKKSATSSEEIDEVPFDVPEGWVWTKIKYIAEVKSSKRVFESDYVDNGIPFYRSKEIGELYRGNEIETSLFITKEHFESLKEKYGVPQSGDILVTSVGTIGNTWICDGRDFYYKDGNVTQICQNQYIYTPYIEKFLHTTSFEEQLESLTGTAYIALTIEKLNQILIPLPPLSEQRRIVTEIEKWFGVIDQLESNEGDLRKAIEQTKKKVLNLAIHGKLVPQDESEEPASELLKRIKEEKAKTTKGKKSPEDVDLDEVPFEVPKGWVWCTGADIFNPMTSCKPCGETFKYVDIDSIDNKHNVITSPKIVNVLEAPSRASRETNIGDVLFSMVRPYLRNIAKITESDCIASTGFYVCKPNEALNSDYCFYLMISDYVVDGLNSFMKGDNSPSINNFHITNHLYPLPPLSEQARIVAKIEEVMGELERIGEMMN